MQALAEAERFLPGLALLDLGLLVMDGYAHAERFAADPRLRNTKLIAVAGYDQEGDRRASAHAAFHAHLLKPVDIDRLREVIDGALRLR